MLCKKPFIRNLHGVNNKTVVLSEDARLAAVAFPCGQCMCCRINKAREWTHRMLLEQTQHSDSSFLTLTYSDEFIPSGHVLEYRDLTNFLKKLRKDVYPKKIRYFAVGEYGDKSLRPHYHMALYGLGILHAKIIERNWPWGFSYIGDLCKDSAAYMTGYVTKKLTKLEEFTQKRIGTRPPEYMRCSKMDGGLGSGAVLEIAKELNKDKRFNRRTIRALRYGKKKDLPLGRYLTNKMCAALGISEEEVRAESYDYHQKMFDQYLQGDGYKYFEAMTADWKPKRLSKEKRYKIFKRKAKI